MLFKHSTRVAQDAVFAMQGAPEAGTAEPLAAPLPTKEEIAIGELNEANEALRRDMAALRADWHRELARVEEGARTAALREHVRDEEKRLTLLAAALEDARRHFERDLLAVVGKSARELAAAALGKLVVLRQADSDWLARIVEQRLVALDRSAVIDLHLSPSDLEEGDFDAVLPQGTRVETDSGLRPGTARLRLRLGTVEIDSDAGLTRLLALLREGEVDG